MIFLQSVLRICMRFLTTLFFRVHAEDLSKVPHNGPMIIVSNHINTAEVGILYGLLKPRPVSGFMAEYRWEALWSRWIGTIAEAIPLQRGEADVAALKRAVAWLQAGKIIAMAPEGTRSEDGRLQAAHPGAVLLALRSNAPMLPLVYYGHENWTDNLKRLRRTDFFIRVGKPFQISPPPFPVNRQVRKEIIDEVMYQLARLLPERNRGVYADLSKASMKYLQLL